MAAIHRDRLVIASHTPWPGLQPLMPQGQIVSADLPLWTDGHTTIILIYRHIYHTIPPTQYKHLISRRWFDVGIVQLSQKVVSKGRHMSKCMKNYIHVIISLQKYIHAQHKRSYHHAFIAMCTLILLSPTIPGRYFVPSRATDSLEEWSIIDTASTENTGRRTNYKKLKYVIIAMILSNEHKLCILSTLHYISHFMHAPYVPTTYSGTL